MSNKKYTFQTFNINTRYEKYFTGKSDDREKNNSFTSTSSVKKTISYNDSPVKTSKNYIGKSVYNVIII